MGTKLTPSAILTFADVVTPNPGEIVRATGGLGVAYRIAGPTSTGDVYYTGNVSGISVVHLGGINKTLLATLIGSLVQIQLGTNGAGTPTSTPIDIKNELLAKGISVLTPTYFGGTGIAGIWETPLKLDGDILGSIRPALQQLLDRTEYLFQGIIGGKRSLLGLFVDGTGDATVAAPSAGEGIATTAWRAGLAAAENIRMEVSRIIAKQTSAASNPSTAVALKNEIRALTMIKCFGRVKTATGAVTSTDGASFSATISAGKILITMPTAMDNNTYTVIPAIEMTALANPGIGWQYVSTAQFYIVPRNNGFDIDLAANPSDVGFVVLGRQTS